MSIYLYKLGRLAFRRRWVVLAFWVVALLLAGLGASTLSGPTSDGFSIPGTQSQQAQDLLKERFPQISAGGATARVVFEVPAGRVLTAPAPRQAVEEMVAKLRTVPEAKVVTDPYTAGGISANGSVGYVQVTYAAPATSVSAAAKDALKSTVDQANTSGLTVDIGGDVLQESAGGATGELIGIAVAALVLMITFGSLLAAGLPLLSAMFGIGLAVSGITIATGFIQLGSQTSTLALMLGLAVAIDYSLFIVSRYRHELLSGHDPESSAGRAAGTAGSAVVFAGLTVVIALAGLTVVNIPFLTEMGLAAAFSVVVAVIIALTLLPALLGFTGSRVLSKKDRKAMAAGAGAQGTVAEAAGQVSARKTRGERWAEFVIRRPVPILLLAVIGLGVLAVPVASIELNLAAAPGLNTTQGRAAQRLTDGFGAGFNGPLLVVLDVSKAKDPAGAAATAKTELAALKDVTAVSPPVLNQAGNTAILTVIPASGPASESTKGLVGTIRSLSAGLTKTTGADMAVTGQTAVVIDVSDRLGGALLPYLSLVIGLAFILLMLVFRSILVPIKATVGFLLSIGATFGVLVAIFQWGWFAGPLGIEGQTGFIMSMLPIFMIGIVFGLAMDYQLFLVTRMREAYVHGETPNQSIVRGFHHGARVVTAAALIMTAVFSGFIFAGQALVMQIGMGLAAAVLFDAFVVRMTVVPAVMALLGNKAWWFPKWLDRIVPNVDVEGEKLTKLLEDAAAAQDQAELEMAR